MKRILLIISVFSTFALFASAQRVNFKVGGGLASHYGGSTKNIGTFKVGASYEHEIPGNFSIEPGVFFYAKGYKDKNEEVLLRNEAGDIVYDDGGNALTGVKNVTTSAFYVEVPLLANYYIEVSDLRYLEISLGPYAAIGVGGKRKTRGDTDEDDARRYYYEKNTFDEEGVHRFDCGVTAGLSYEFGRMFAVGAEFDFGLLDFNRKGGKNVSGTITFSYRLRLNN